MATQKWVTGVPRVVAKPTCLQSPINLRSTVILVALRCSHSFSHVVALCAAHLPSQRLVSIDTVSPARLWSRQHSMSHKPGTPMYWACILRDWSFPYTGHPLDMYLRVGDFLVKNDFNSLDQLNAEVHPRKWTGASAFDAKILDALYEMCS